VEVSRVYLIFRNQLFNDAVGAVLGTHPDIKLVGATDNPDQVAADVASLAPDVVLLEETGDGLAMNNVSSILSSRTPCRLITLHLDENGMHVWSQTWRQTVHPQDLVEAIITAGGSEL
jgi:chemotaxis response regulator CheB